MIDKDKVGRAGTVEFSFKRSWKTSGVGTMQASAELTHDQRYVAAYNKDGILFDLPAELGAPLILAMLDFYGIGVLPDELLIEALREKGYKGELTHTKTITI